MKLVDRLNHTLENDLSLRTLVKLALLFVIVWLFQATAGFWGGVLGKVWQVIRPFVLGFVIAFVLRGPIVFLEKHKIPRKVSIPVLYLLILLLFGWLIGSLIPLLLNRMSSLINSVIGGVNWLYGTFTELSENGAPQWLGDLVNQAVESLSDVKNLIPAASESIPDLVNSALSYVVTMIFTIVVSIFMCSGWEKIRGAVTGFCLKISDKFNRCVFAIDHELSTYVRSLLILIVIRFVEYSAVYLIVGHPDWLILAIATAVSAIIPYLGPTIVNVIGIITALNLAPWRIVLLIAFIAVLSFVDEYVIAPLVHSHNTSVPPLWALFSIFAGGSLLGTWGIIIGIPVFLALRVVISMYGKKQKELSGVRAE
jgi:predicted PurR-regulated permease PerM